MPLWASQESQWLTLRERKIRVRGASEQPNSLCKQQQINSREGCSERRQRLILTSLKPFLSLFPFVFSLSVSLSVFHPLRLSLRHQYHCFNPPTATDIGEGVNVKPMYLLTFFLLSYDRCLFVFSGMDIDALTVWGCEKNSPLDPASKQKCVGDRSPRLPSEGMSAVYGQI